MKKQEIEALTNRQLKTEIAERRKLAGRMYNSGNRKMGDRVTKITMKLYAEADKRGLRIK